MAKKRSAKKFRGNPDEATSEDLYPSQAEGTDNDDAEYDEGYIRKYVLACREEAQTAKFDRLQQNKQNWDLYHMRHDFAHKIEGQSREILSLQSMAVETTAAFFQQALVDEGDWWGSAAKDPKSESKMKVRPDVVHDITQMQLEKAEIMRHVNLGTKNGLLSALVIAKVTGKYVPVPQYVAHRDPKKRKATLKRVDKKVWQLDLKLVSDKHYYPDPTGAGLYEIEEMWCDYHEILALAEGDDAIYDLDKVEELAESHGTDDAEESLDQRRKTNQNEATHGFRNRVKLTEFYGTILDEDGRILCENCFVTIANDKHVIRMPTPNPFWHQESPYITAGLLEVPDAVWPKALMDAPTRHNIAATEVYNLMVDGGMRAVNGIGMVRTEWLENPSDIENGIKAGSNLKVNSSCPPGAKVLEMVQAGSLPPDAMNLYNIMNQEFNRSALTSDIRQGVSPQKDVSATQIVETSNTISSVFKGVTTHAEQNWLKPVLRKSWMLCAQYSDEMDEHEVRALLGDRADAFLKLTPEERFAETVQGIRYDVYGITQQVAKQQDFRKLTTLAQTIGASEPMLESFVKRYSLDEFVTELMRALGINVRRLEISQDEQDMMKQQQQEQAPPGPAGPDQMSQVQSPNTGSLAEQLGAQAGPEAQAAGQAANFPPSKATPRGGPQ